MKQRKISPCLVHPAFIWTGVSVVLLVGLPWFIVTAIHSDAAMAACFLLFYAIDPVLAIAAGMFAGKDTRRLWFLPILIPLLFLLGTWLCFAPPDPVFVGYAFVYVLLGGTTMLIFFVMTKRRKK